MGRAKTKQVPIPDQYQPYPVGSAEWYIAWNRHPEEVPILEAQGEATRNVQEMIDCGECKKPTDLPLAYKCLYCGIYYCFDCAGIHFGRSYREWILQRRASLRDAHKLP